MSVNNIVAYSEEFSQRFNSDIQRYRNFTPTEKSEYKKIFDIQTQFEDRYVIESRICHPSGHESLLGISVTDLSGINRESIINNLRTKFYDHNLMEEMRCLINTIIDIEDGDGVSERARIQHFMESLKRFGSPSAYNYALIGGIKAEEHKTKDDHLPYHKYTGDMFVVKCPREPVNSKELMHELVCGTAALNNLRQYIPNFSYVYDAFYCDAPIVNDETKDVISWCMNSENPVSYVVYEAVQKPKAFGDIAKNKKPHVSKNFLMYIGQVSLAEYLAEILYNFTHCDAHGDNVLISEYQPETQNGEPLFYIPYSFQGKVYYTPSPGGIAMFIDYGMSRVVIPGGNDDQGICLGKLDASGFFSSIGISPFDAMAVADIHKLLCFILRNAVIEENRELMSCVGGLLCGYFYGNETPTEDEIISLLTIQLDARYHVPPEIVRSKGWNMIGFIEYLDIFSIKYDVKILNNLEDLPENSKFFGDIMENITPTPIEIKEELSIVPAKIPSLFDLSQNPTNEELRRSTIANIKMIIKIEASSIHRIMDDLTHPFHVINPDVSKMDENLSIFTTSIQDIAEILSNCGKLKEKLKELRIAETLIACPEIDSLISEVDSKLKMNIQYINKLKNAINENYQTLQKFIFGRIKSGPLSEDEVSKYGEHKYFNLYDKYNKVISILNSL